MSNRVMSTDISKSTALVTGGSKGYGAGIAEALKERGTQVWITARNEEVLEATAARLGVHGVRADVTSSEDWDRVFDEVLKDSGGLDILVNNAGAGIHIAPLDEQSDEEIAQSIAVNLIGPIFGARRAAQVMRKQGSGTIINISSVCARQAWPGFAVYSGAKSGMVQFGKCLFISFLLKRNYLFQWRPIIYPAPIIEFRRIGMIKMDFIFLTN